MKISALKRIYKLERVYGNSRLVSVKRALWLCLFKKPQYLKPIQGMKNPK